MHCGRVEVSGSALISRLGTGSPGDDPIGSPADRVSLAGARREFGGGRLRHLATSSRPTSQTEPDVSTPLTEHSAAKTLSALASPRAAASPLETFVGAVSTLINTALKAVSGALTSVFTAINNAITTVLRAVGLAPKANQALIRGQ